MDERSFARAVGLPLSRPGDHWYERVSLRPELAGLEPGSDPWQRALLTDADSALIAYLVPFWHECSLWLWCWWHANRPSARTVVDLGGYAGLGAAAYAAMDPALHAWSVDLLDGSTPAAQFAQLVGATGRVHPVQADARQVRSQLRDAPGAPLPDGADVVVSSRFVAHLGPGHDTAWPDRITTPHEDLLAHLSGRPDTWLQDGVSAAANLVATEGTVVFFESAMTARALGDLFAAVAAAGLRADLSRSQIVALKSQMQPGVAAVQVLLVAQPGDPVSPEDVTVWFDRQQAAPPAVEPWRRFQRAAGAHDVLWQVDIGAPGGLPDGSRMWLRSALVPGSAGTFLLLEANNASWARTSKLDRRTLPEAEAAVRGKLDEARTRGWDVVVDGDIAR